MSTTTEELQVVLTGDVADFAASMKAATGALNTIASGMQKAQKAAAQTQTAMEKFTATMTRAGEKAEMIGKQFKKLGSVGQDVAMGLTAAFAGAFLGGAKYDQGVASQLEELKDIAGNLAAEVANALMPAARELAEWLRNLLGWVQGLNPELKENIANYAVMALKIAAVVAAIGKVGSVVDDLAEFGTKMLVPLLPVAGTLLAIVAVVGTLALAYGFVASAMDGAFGPKVQKTMMETMAIIGSYAEMLKAIASGDFSGAAQAFAGAQEAQRIAGKRRAKEGSGLGELDLGNALSVASKKFIDDLGSGMTAAGSKLLGMLGLESKGDGKSARVRGPLGKPEKAEDDGLTGYAHQPNMGRGGAYTDITPLNEHFNQIKREEEERIKGYRELGAKFRAVNQRAMADEAQAAYEASERIQAGVMDMASRFVAAAGRAGEIASNAMQSAKQLGPVGAIISVILDIFMDMKAGALAINNATKGLRMITRLLDEIFGEMSIVMEVLLRGSVIPLILAFKTMGVPTLGLAIAIGEAMNWFYQLGANIGALLTGQEMRWVEFVDLTGLKEKFAQIRDMDPLATYERLSALDDAANSADNFSHTLDSISESMTNIPATFKLAAHRFAAQDATGGGGGFHSASPVLNARTGARGEIINININGNVVGGLPQDIVDQIERAIGRRNFTRTGHPAANL